MGRGALSCRNLWVKMFVPIFACKITNKVIRILQSHLTVPITIM